MKLLRPATLTVSLLAVLLAFGAVHLARTGARAKAKDVSRNPRLSLAASVDSRPQSSRIGRPLDTQIKLAPADPHASERPTLAPPEEDGNQPTLAAPELSVHLPPRPGRHVLYVRVEAEQLPPETGRPGGSVVSPQE